MTQQTKHHSLTVKKLISAPCEQVFAAWSKPELMKLWLYPNYSWSSKTTNDFKVGGHYQHEMIAEDGKGYVHHGEYKEIIPNKKIVFTWNSPAVSDTLVTVDLHDRQGKTEVVLTHELFLTEQARESHLGGWTSVLENLNSFLPKGVKEIKKYQCSVIFNASPDKVYQAITSEKGLKNWWTPDCTIDTKVGEESTFRFDKTYNVMKIKELIPNKKVVWDCVKQHHDNDKFRKHDEWVGTEVSFYLSECNPGETVLNFQHEGLTKSLECFNLCENGWNYFLKDSLKSYIETGKGKPYDHDCAVREKEIS